MPQLVIAAAAYGAGYLVGGQIIAAIAMTAASYTYSARVARREQKRIAAAESEARRNQTILVRSAAEPRRIVYGGAMLSGPLAFAESVGEANNELHLILPLCEGPIQAIDEVYIDEDAIGTLDGSGWATAGRFVKTETLWGNATTPASGMGAWSVVLPYTPTTVNAAVAEPAFESMDNWVPTAYSVGGSTVSGSAAPANARVNVDYQYSNPTSKHARVKKYLGSDSQVADADLINATTKWTSAHRLRGIAYVYLTLRRDESVFPTGLGNIKCKLRGRTLFDPRSGLTAYSDNPALAIRDYLTSSYGLGCATSEIDDSTFSAAANVCDQLVQSSGGQNFSGTVNRGANEKRYTVNGVVDLSRSPRDILEDLLTTCAGTLVYSEGKWKLFAGAYVTPTITLTEADLAGHCAILPTTPRRDLFNAVSGTYFGPENGWTVANFPTYVSSTYVAEDGGTQITRDLDLPFTISGSEAQRIARQILEVSRRPLTLEVECNLKQAFRLQAGDAVMVTLSRFGFSAKVFRVIGWQWSIPGTVRLTLKEDDSGAYAWSYTGAAEIPAPANSNLPNPFTRPDAPTSFQTQSSQSLALRNPDGTIEVRIKATWDATTDANVLTGGRVELEFSRAGDPEVSFGGTLVAPPDTVEFYAGPCHEGATYIARIRFVNAIGVASDWVYDTVVATGKTAGPQAPTALTATGITLGARLTWQNPWDPDFDTIEIWEGSTSTWASATLIDVIVGSTYQRLGLSSGAVRYYWVRARDTYGNTSAEVGPQSATAQAGSATPGPGSITSTSQFAGVTPIEIVGALPGTGNFEGRVVYLTTDDKLYRWTGGAWTAAIPTSDLTGTITETQIASDAITTPKLAANAVTAAKITAGTITATEIAANTITGAKIAAAAIGTTQLAAQSVTVSKLNAIPFIGANMVVDPYVEDTSAWTTTGVWTRNTYTDAGAGRYMYSTTAQNATLWSSLVHFDPTKVYRLTARAASSAGTTLPARLVVEFLDSNQVTISSTLDPLGWESISTPYFGWGLNYQVPAVPSGSNPATEYTSTFGVGWKASAPTGARYIRVGVIVGSTGSGTVRFGGFGLFEVAPASLQLNAYAGPYINRDPACEDPTSWEITPNRTDWTRVEDASSLGRYAWSTAAASARLASSIFPIEPSRVYRMSADFKESTSATRQLTIGLEFMDKDYGAISGIGSGWEGGTSSAHYADVNADLPTSWATGSFTFGSGQAYTIPSNARYARIVFISTSGTGTVYVAAVRISQVIPAELIVDGTITAQKIASGAITADRISANTITANEIQIGGVNTGSLASQTVSVHNYLSFTDVTVTDTTETNTFTPVFISKSITDAVNYLWFQCRLENAVATSIVTIRVYRGTTLLYTTAQTVYTTFNEMVSVCFGDFPSAGTYAYKVTVQFADAGTRYVREPYLILMQIKR